MSLAWFLIRVINGLLDLLALVEFKFCSFSFELTWCMFFNFYIISILSEILGHILSLPCWDLGKTQGVIRIEAMWAAGHLQLGLIQQILGSFRW